MKWWNLIRGYAWNELGPNVEVLTAWARAEVCSECPALKVFSEDEVYDELPPGSKLLWKAPPHSGWCGTPGNPEGWPDVCGCLTLAETTDPTPITVKGKPMEPAGKATKAGFACPRGKW